MAATHRQILAMFRPQRIIIPILLGLSVTFFLVFRDFNTQRPVKTQSGQGEYVWVDTNADKVVQAEELQPQAQGDYTMISQQEAWQNIDWNWGILVWLSVAALCMVLRDFAYILRIRLLTDYQLSWKKAFQVIMLWEFASSITPSVVGGSAFALFIINKEGISTGKSTAIVMITAFLDELFYVVMVPLVFLFAAGQLFIGNNVFSIFGFSLGTQEAFYAGYVFILFLISIIAYGIFWKPRQFKWLILKIFKLKFLRKWREAALQTGNDIITTSKQMRGRSFWFWTKAFLTTVLSWTARFWMVNFIILAFTPVGNHLLIYARQLVMWVILLISPTPGGSGVAEFFFPQFLGEFIPPGFSDSLAFLWRSMSYYPYLIIGIMVLPYWVRRVYLKRRLIRFGGTKK